MLAFALELDDFFLWQQLIAAIRGHLVEFLEPLYGLLHSHPIGEQPAQPTLVDIETVGARRLFADGILRLALSTDEKYRFAGGGQIGNKLRRFFEHLQRLL